jgi:glucose-6-phosphate isomerase
MASKRKSLLNTMMKHRSRLDGTTMREMFAADPGRFKR